MTYDHTPPPVGEQIVAMSRVKNRRGAEWKPHVNMGHAKNALQSANEGEIWVPGNFPGDWKMAYYWEPVNRIHTSFGSGAHPYSKAGPNSILWAAAQNRIIK